LIYSHDNEEKRLKRGVFLYKIINLNYHNIIYTYHDEFLWNEHYFAASELPACICLDNNHINHVIMHISLCIYKKEIPLKTYPNIN